MATTGEAVVRPPAGLRRPAVEVVVPCYNYGHLLPGCLASVLGQPGVAVRAHVIDDASPDGSGERAEALARADPRIRVTRHRANAGHIATYNEGLAAAAADYVVLLSADDLLAPGALGRATALLEAHPEAAFAYGYSRYFTDAGGPPVAPGRVRARVRVEPGPQWIERRLRSGTNVISSPEVVVRTSVQQAAGGYRADLPHSGDLEMWLRLAARGSVGMVIGADAAYYRVHAASMSRTSFATEFADLRQRYAAFDTFLAESGEVLAEPDAGRRRMARALAAAALWRAARLRMARPGAPSGGMSDTAEAMADWALSIAPDAAGTPEFRALRRASRRGRYAAGHPGVLATAAHRRSEAGWLAVSRHRRCR
jgi:GT2 family glycosyltransferase